MAEARKVYGSLNSPATLKLLALLFELDVPFDFISIDLDAGEHKKKPFLSMSPFGEVPVYEEGGIFFFESRTTLRCLAHQYGHKGEPLIDWEPRKQAILSNWVDVEDHHFEPPALKLVFELAIKPSKGLAPDGAAVAEAEAELAKVLDVYEGRLENFEYLVSEKYTIVDVLHLPNMHSLLGTSAKKLIETRPGVSAWCSKILARPAWAKVIEMQKKAQHHPAI